MRLALLAAAAAMLYGCASPASKTAGSATPAPSPAAADGIRNAQLRPEPKYTLQRPEGERLGVLARQTGHFSAPYLIVTSADTGALHRFQASTGTYHDELGGDVPADQRIAKPQALTTFGQELWIADGSGRRLQQFFGFDPKFVETLEHESLKSPISLLFVTHPEQGRLLFVLDRDGEQLRLHRFQTRVLRATAPDRPDRIRLGELVSVDVGSVSGVPVLIHDTDGNRLVLIHGTQVRAWDLDLNAVQTPIADGILQGTSIGAGLLACTSSLDKGYWFVAEASQTGTTIRFVGYEQGNPRGSVQLEGTDWRSGMLFDRSNMALFPRGAIFAVEGGQKINGYAWDEITRTAGLRAHCF